MHRSKCFHSNPPSAALSHMPNFLQGKAPSELTPSIALSRGNRLRRKTRLAGDPRLQPWAESQSRRARLKDHALITHAPRHALAVQMLEQRDGILAADAGQLFERGDGQAVTALRLVRGQELAQACQRGLVKYQILGDFYQHLFAQQN